MDDIRSKRYKLRQVMIDGAIPPKVKKDAHDVILDFIRSRPPLRPVRFLAIISGFFVRTRKKVKGAKTQEIKNSNSLKKYQFSGIFTVQKEKTHLKNLHDLSQMYLNFSVSGR